MNYSNYCHICGIPMGACTNPTQAETVQAVEYMLNTDSTQVLQQRLHQFIQKNWQQLLNYKRSIL